MCSIISTPMPVFLDGAGPRTPFLDDLLGVTIADGLRALAGYPPLHPPVDGQWGFSGCDLTPASYLSVSYSSLWAFGVCLLCLVAGAAFLFRRKRALVLLGAGILVSLLDTGFRFAGRYGGTRADTRQAMLDALPGQLAANLLFQIVLPGLLTLAIAWAGRGIYRKLTGSP